MVLRKLPLQVFDFLSEKASNKESTFPEVPFLLSQIWLPVRRAPWMYQSAPQTVLCLRSSERVLRRTQPWVT